MLKMLYYKNALSLISSRLRKNILYDTKLSSHMIKLEILQKFNPLTIEDPFLSIANKINLKLIPY